MRFRLTYEGLLKQRGGLDHIHEIRRQFHPQLKSLWEVYPGLKEWGALKHHTAEKPRLETLTDMFRKGAYRFVPIASNAHAPSRPDPVVSLDILFLRNGTPGGILKSGDIDGRLKTLFDALRMPQSEQEMGSYKSPGVDETPFHVLMHDDRLVGNVSVTTDTLLQPTPGNDHHTSHDSRLVISVHVRDLSGWGHMP